MFYVQYQGYVDISYWEYLMALGYLFFLYLYFARQKNVEIKQHPEYAYFLWGLYAKILGGVAFSLIYFYYYKGGDTISYFYSAVSMSKLAKIDFLDYLTVLFGDNSVENRRFFTPETGWPFGYMYFDTRTYMVVRVISVLALFTFDSYLVCTVVLASLSYIGVWKAFRTFVSYFPELQGKFAIAFLFMPSLIFWGSAILKDTFTLAFVCLWVSAADELFYKKRSRLPNGIALLVSGLAIITIKPYIFMVLFPLTLVWLLYFPVVRVKSTLVKFVLLPAMFITLVVGTVVVLQQLEDKLDKFSLDKAIHTIEVTQNDMKRSEQYGANYFDVGEFDGTWTGLLTKFPVATTAGLFRPFIWEARSVVMALSGLENLWVLLLAFFTVLKLGPFFLFRSVGAIPIVLLCFLFALMFAFMVGITTPNFGALVRFKIPLVPFFISMLYVLRYLREKALDRERRGLQFDVNEYQLGSGPILAAQGLMMGKNGKLVRRDGDRGPRSSRSRS